SAIGTPAKVIGSSGRMPYSTPAIRRATTAAHSTPTTVPAHAAKKPMRVSSIGSPRSHSMAPHAARAAPPFARCGPRAGDGADGRRPRPRLLGRAGRRTDAGRLLHALDHALLRARVRVFRRHGGVPARTLARRHPAAGPLPPLARPLAGRAGADDPAARLDVQLRLRALRAGRRDLDARLVHGAPG